ncbi:MAG: 2-amino-4-hydroxy-6-hydroxymethyldihydropteridine diphosphokinase [Sphingomonadales bacterium]|nr:MAG: 2-amino-4-hydroxy-6-hydroxymethyldihydropteridine diphosphokinase [Sphingomonadales bacterium]
MFQGLALPSRRDRPATVTTTSPAAGTPATYVIALGSNRRGRHGSPEDEIAAALALLQPRAVSPILRTAPLGPSKRRFANAAAVLETRDDPPALLARLKAIERSFGRRPGRTWGMRVIDLDIILWSGGAWGETALTIPHPHFRARDFVLRPLLAIAPDWRDPISGRTVRQLFTRLTAPHRIPR